MALQTVRPDSTVSNPGGWTVGGGAGTLWNATSDNSDATYAAIATGAGLAQSFTVGLGDITLGAGDRVLQYRVRLRGRLEATTGAQLSAVFTPGASNPVAQVQFVTPTTTPTTKAGSWVAASTVPGSNAINNGELRATRNAFPVGAARINELYVDVDVRERPVQANLEVRDASGTDRCGGTVTDTSTPSVAVDVTYGYSGAPNNNALFLGQVRIFTDAQVATSGFDPWEDGPWGPPVYHSEGQVSRSAQGVTFVLGTPAISDALPNGDYVAYRRTGALDFVNITGEPWWSNTESCAWTQDVPVPDPPDVECEATSCPPTVEIDVTHEGASGGVEWDDPDLVRAQVQVTWDGGDTWSDVIGGTNGSVVAEGNSWTVYDRFVQVSTPEGGGCGAGDAVTREATYRVRLYGWVDGAEQSTEWTECGPISVPRCTDDPCAHWLIHPTSNGLDWTGHADRWGWTSSRPFSATQPASGGTPTAVSGAPSGRDHELRFVTVDTPDTLALLACVAAPVNWYIPEDPHLPAIWVAVGPETDVEPQKIPSDTGAVHIVTLPTVQVEPPPVVLPPAEEP